MDPRSGEHSRITRIRGSCGDEVDPFFAIKDPIVRIGGTPTGSALAAYAYRMDFVAVRSGLRAYPMYEIDVSGLSPKSIARNAAA